MIKNVIHKIGRRATEAIFERVGIRTYDSTFNFHLKKVKGKCAETEVFYIPNSTVDDYYGPNDISFFDINIDPNLTAASRHNDQEARNMFAFLLAHELQHAKQFLTGSLRMNRITRDSYLWENKHVVFHKKVKPEKLLPWEIEADAVGRRVANSLVEDGLVKDELAAAAKKGILPFNPFQLSI